jgi:PAS domain-containing protein
MKLMEKYHSLRVNNLEIPPKHYEIKLKDKEGNIKTILINLALIPGTKRTIASRTDLTELKMAEKKLQMTLNRFYTILSNMRASVLLVTEDDKIEFANQAFGDYFGLNDPPENLVGLTASEMIDKIKYAYEYPEEELVRIGEVVGQWDPVIGEEVSMQGGRTCLRDFIPIFVCEIPYGRLWLHLDITERMKMEMALADKERRYRYIVEKATAGIFILDKNGIIKYLNGHFAQILDFTKNEMLEAHISSFLDEEGDFHRPRKPYEIHVERYNWFNTPECTKAISSYLIDRERKNKPIKSLDDPLFVNSQNQALNKSSHGSIFKRVNNRANFGYITNKRRFFSSTMLRKYFKIQLDESGLDESTINALLGQKLDDNVNYHSPDEIKILKSSYITALDGLSTESLNIHTETITTSEFINSLIS